jgi:tetratricopeptide (TPR) repeat protein
MGIWTSARGRTVPGEREPSYTDLVHHVVQESADPLSVDEIVERVGALRPLTTRKPSATVRNALSQSRTIISLGDGRYGYLPRLASGSRLRIPLVEKRPANSPIELPADVRCALWPAYFDIQKRQERRPVVARLPVGKEAELSLEFLGAGVWGWPVGGALREYLVERRAAAGDSLLMTVLDGERGICELVFESRLKRDQAAVAQSNGRLAAAVVELLRRRGSTGAWTNDIAASLLATGLYRDPPTPDPLEAILRADRRFTYSGLLTWILSERVTPELAELIADRERMERRLAKLVESPIDVNEELSGPADPLSSRRAMERTLAEVSAQVSEQEFESPEKIDDFVARILSGGPLPRTRKETPLERAQSLMYDAWEATSPRERERLAREALRVSADCADAYVLLAEETARTILQAAELYAKGVAAGERAFGDEYFRQNAGRFWGIVETRPYMRARFGLARTLWRMGKRREAMDHLRAILDLNHSDNQGVRYSLLDWLLEAGDDDGARRLLDRFRDEPTAAWAFGAALLAFRTEGDSPTAGGLLASAMDANRHAAAYLLGRRRLPREMPQYVGFGDEAEAVTLAAGQLPAWKSTRGALAWLDRRSSTR